MAKLKTTIRQNTGENLLTISGLPDYLSHPIRALSAPFLKNKITYQQKTFVKKFKNKFDRTDFGELGKM